QTTDYLLMYARDISRVKYRQLYKRKVFGGKGASGYNRVRLADGTTRALTSEEKDGANLPDDSLLYCLDNITSQSMGRDKGEGAACWFPVSIGGREYRPSPTA